MRRTCSTAADQPRPVHVPARSHVHCVMKSAGMGKHCVMILRQEYSYGYTNCSVRQVTCSSSCSSKLSHANEQLVEGILSQPAQLVSIMDIDYGIYVYDNVMYALECMNSAENE